MRIASRGDHPTLHRADTAVDVKRGRECLSRVILLREMREKATRVEEHGMSADRRDDRNPCVVKLWAEVAHLMDAMADVVVVDHLENALGDGLHVAAGQAAISRHPLEDHDL